MTDVTRILSALAQGDAHAAEQLLPLVYEELRKLAARRLAREKPGQTLDATALVHEAYLRLVGADPEQPWDSRGHFFGAAAEAMRRILVEQARRKGRVRHGGGRRRVDLLDEVAAPSDEVDGGSGEAGMRSMQRFRSSRVVGSIQWASSTRKSAASRALPTNRRSFSASLTPGAASTPLATSTA